eukprot:2781794-Rhodomonas_salina.3
MGEPEQTAQVRRIRTEKAAHVRQTSTGKRGPRSADQSAYHVEGCGGGRGEAAAHRAAQRRLQRRDLTCLQKRMGGAESRAVSAGHVCVYRLCAGHGTQVCASGHRGVQAWDARVQRGARAEHLPAGPALLEPLVDWKLDK